MLNQKLFIVTAIWLIVLVISCSDSATNNEKQGFSGITKTTETGAVISVDPDDWGCGEPIEQSSDTGTRPLLPTMYCFGPAYPNPATDGVVVTLDLPESTTVRIWIRSESNLIIELFNNTLMPGHYNWFWDCSSESKGLYRTFMETPSWKRHGDIQVE